MIKSIEYHLKKYITEKIATYLCLLMSIVILIEVSIILVIDNNMQDAKERYIFIHDLIKKDKMKNFLPKEYNRSIKFYV